MMRNCSRLAQFHFQRLLFVQRLEYRQKNSITPKPIVRFLSLTIATLRMSQKKSKSSKKSLIETFVWTLPKIRTHHNQSSFSIPFQRTAIEGRGNTLQRTFFTQPIGILPRKCDG